MRKKIKSIEEALDLYALAAVDNLSGGSDYKKINRAYKILEKVRIYLLENNSIEVLRKFYYEDNICARLSASISLAPIDKDKAKTIAREIMDMDIGAVSFNAEYTLENWDDLSDPNTYHELLEQHSKKKK